MRYGSIGTIIYRGKFFGQLLNRNLLLVEDLRVLWWWRRLLCCITCMSCQPTKLGHLTNPTSYAFNVGIGCYLKEYLFMQLKGCICIYIWSKMSAFREV